jgi:hypothetical protein
VDKWVVLEWIEGRATEMGRLSRWEDADLMRTGLAGSVSIDSAESWDQNRGRDERTPVVAQAVDALAS